MRALQCGREGSLLTAPALGTGTPGSTASCTESPWTMTRAACVPCMRTPCFARLMWVCESRNVPARECMRERQGETALFLRGLKDEPLQAEHDGE